MVTQHRLLALFLALGLLIRAGATAQTPAAPSQLDVATTKDSQLVAGSALDGQGTVTLLWTQIFHSSNLPSSARGRRFAREDLPLGPDVVFDKKESDAVEVVANRRGDFIAAWNARLPAGGAQGVLRRMSPVLKKLTLRLNHLIDDVAVDQAGNFVVVWSTGGRVFGQRYNSNGSKRGPEFNPATTLEGSQFSPRVAMNHLTGEFVVLWQRGNADLSIIRIFAQRFGFTTGRQGSEIRVSNRSYAGGDRLFADVGRAEDGSFVVVWSSRPTSPEEAVSDVFGQRFNNAGGKSGGEIVISDDTRILDGYVRLSVAPQGQFVAAWDDGGPPLLVRLYHRDGTPAGPARQLQTVFPGTPEPAFGWDGTFVLGWTDFIGIHQPNDDTWEANYQRFAASPGAELCVFRNGHFRCDTDRNGGALEIDHAFGLTAGVPLLGDLDDDGRDDYCLFQGTRFECDSGHDYGPGESIVPFGLPGDTPLLGDVDGDDRDETCVFRSGRFLCDTAHDGSAAELEIVFGQPGDRALLGDVDGDGSDDPCTAHAEEIRCDTAHDGGSAETVIAFSTGAGAVPLLGDVDGDGRDDPCAFKAGTFRCDTGGPADFVLATGIPGRPLIGNVDGL